MLYDCMHRGIQADQPCRTSREAFTSPFGATTLVHWTKSAMLLCFRCISYRPVSSIDACPDLDGGLSPLDTSVAMAFVSYMAMSTKRACWYGATAFDALPLVGELLLLL